MSHSTTTYSPSPLSALCLSSSPPTDWRWWARKVARRQARSFARVALTRLPGDAIDPVADAEPPKPVKPSGPIPTTIADLLRPELPHGRINRFSSRYIGVSKRSYERRWRAFYPGTGGRETGSLGTYSTEELAAQAVLRAVRASMGVTG